MMKILRKNKYILFLLLLGFMTGLNACFLFQKEEPGENTETLTPDNGSDAREEDPFQDEAFDKYFEEDTTNTGQDEYPEDETENTPPDEETSEADTYSFDEDERDKGSASTSDERSINQKEDYLVVAGSFSIRENAEGLVTRLRSLGYKDAEVVIFNEQEFHTASAGRFDDYNTAKTRADELKSQYGIEAYVHRRRLPN